MQPNSMYNSVLLSSVCYWCLWLGLTVRKSMVAVWPCQCSSTTSLWWLWCGWGQRPSSCSRSWSSSSLKSLPDTLSLSPSSVGVSPETHTDCKCWPCCSPSRRAPDSCHHSSCCQHRLHGLVQWHGWTTIVSTCMHWEFAITIKLIVVNRHMRQFLVRVELALQKPWITFDRNQLSLWGLHYCTQRAEAVKKNLDFVLCVHRKLTEPDGPVH